MITRLEALYDAADRAGLLVRAETDGGSASVEFRAPDEPVLEGLALSADYAIRYPVSALPTLAIDDEIVVAGVCYQVRDIRAVGDGAERRADLTRLEPLS
ncbi:hypothetical protein ONV78_24325 [Hahella sp. CR1]|uniref:head-tail joining protein n=1 Tax=Hahella sp. CR1 TaxID=2992807 RepID=UPI002441AA9A|nr:hypothetical protein [Hahella sp. CR1]MDG9670888.1 hypothetical protein [Hahella sp. CR1]